LAKEPLVCQIIGNHPIKDQNCDHDQNIGREIFSLNLNKPMIHPPTKRYTSDNVVEKENILQWKSLARGALIGVHKKE
jgi:hypothetical protein